MSAISLFAVLAVVTDTLCPRVLAPVEAADVHVRCRAPWSLEWHDAASGAARRLAIDARHDNIYGDKASVEYITGTDSVLLHRDLDVKDASEPVSLRITKGRYGTRIYAVNGEEVKADGADNGGADTGDVHIDGDNNDGVDFDGSDMDINFAPGSAIVARHDSQVCPAIARASLVYRYEPRKYAMNPDQMAEHLARSTDMTEGLWEFMDSDIGVEGAVALAPLRIATLRDGDGYAIVYLSGYETPGVWTAMDVKGRMTPTPFIRDYDLKWYCADGTELGGQIHASVDENGSILTLNLGSQPMAVRFRRIR